MNTLDLAKAAIDISVDFPHVKCEVVKGEELKRRGFGGIYNVGRAGVQPPHMVVLKIEGSDKDAAPCAVIAKGIIYDTGGLALKARRHGRQEPGPLRRLLGVLYDGRGRGGQRHRGQRPRLSLGAAGKRQRIV